MIGNPHPFTALEGWSELPHDESFPAVVAGVHAPVDVAALISAMEHVLGDRPVVLVDGTGLLTGAAGATRLRRAIATGEAAGPVDPPWISEPSISQAILGATLLTAQQEALLVTWPAADVARAHLMAVRALSTRGAFRPADGIDLAHPVRGLLL